MRIQWTYLSLALAVTVEVTEANTPGYLATLGPSALRFEAAPYSGPRIPLPPFPLASPSLAQRASPSARPDSAKELTNSVGQLAKTDAPALAPVVNSATSGKEFPRPNTNDTFISYSASSTALSTNLQMMATPDPDNFIAAQSFLRFFRHRSTNTFDGSGLDNVGFIPPPPTPSSSTPSSAPPLSSPVYKKVP